MGSPSTVAHSNRAILHHTLGDGDLHVFADMFKRVTVAQALLDDLSTAAQEVDRALEQCWIQKKPVYIRLPTDMVEKQLDAGLLQTPLHLEPRANNAGDELALVEHVLGLIHAAQNPVLLIDAHVSRYRVRCSEPRA